MIIPAAVIPQIPVALPVPVAVEPALAADTDNKSKQKDSQSDGSNQQNKSLSNDKNQTKSDVRLTEEETAKVQDLVLRDREVRAHESAHKGAAGQYGGATEYTYTRGPNGKSYATGGEVAIDVSTPDDPEEALRKGGIIQRAALAPVEPSGQDRKVAAQAAEMSAKARAEIQQERTDSVSPADEEEKEDQEEPNAVDAVYSIDTEERTNKIDLTA